MDAGHLQAAQANAVTIQRYLLANPTQIANYTVRCYEHEKDDVQTVIVGELRKVLEPAELKRVRIIYVEFKALTEPALRTIDVGTLFVKSAGLRASVRKRSRLH